MLAAGCTQRGGTPASNAAATQDTTPPALLTSAEIARMRRVPLDTIPTHIEPIDNIIRGPSARIVVVRAEYLPAAWTIVGARGTPPVIDFNRDAVILIGTAIHGGTWSVTTDSLYAAG
ncbi:MAG TPA: hypothetical protein VGT98_12585, partial [Candidatus Elarobacter sp.]|nr:hypothetical protein [Candidatus Elarobacter sp.]